MSATSTGTWATFGELLRYLRRRVGQTQRELGLAVGYSEGQIARLEGGQRLPDLLAVKTVFVEALGLARTPELAARLIELATAARDEAFPPAESLAPSSPLTPTNLPTQLTRFIGREREVAELKRLLGTHRLLTLTGSGGVGKTRLAVEVGLTLVSGEVGVAPAFPDGVWLAELAPLADAALVPRAVAEVFRLPDEPGRTPTAALAAHLADKQALLILDNCEHVIAACAELAEALLRACSRLVILATSREALRAVGEVAWRVPSLPVPDPAALPGLERVLDYEAVQLFVEHASQAQPGFTLTPGNLAAIALICARLDGIPLAIEMAAAQVAVLSVTEIAARLDDRFALLTSGNRTALPRQRTLQATLDWSYQLLSEPERVLLIRLSVFADGCTADAAQAVCADSPVSLPGKATAGVGQAPSHPLSPAPLLLSGRLGRGDVLPLLLELVHKSLVVADTRGDAGPTGRTRFRLLETVRQFSLGKLGELGEVDAAYERLAAYLLARPVPKAYEWAVTADLAQLEAELGNVRALMVWARARPDEGEMSLRLATALSGLWVQRGHLAEPQTWLEEALTSRGNMPAELRAQALTDLLRLLSLRGYNLARWSALAEESLVLAATSGDVAERLEALVFAGVAALDRLDLRRFEAVWEEGLALSQGWEYPYGIYLSLVSQGYLCMMRGDRPGAASRYRQSLQVAQEDQNWGSIRVVLCLMAFVERREALVLCEQEVARCRAGGHPEDLATILQVYAQLLLLSGEGARARATLEECLALWRTLGVQWNVGTGTARTLQDLGQVAWLQGDPATALTHYEESLEQYRHVGDIRQTAQLQVLIGYARLAQGDLDGAAGAFGQGLALLHELGRRDGLDQALAGAAALAEAQGQGERAARLFGAAAVPPPTLLFYWPADYIIFEREVAAARARFDLPAFAAAWAEGEQMTLEQATAYALQNT